MVLVYLTHQTRDVFYPAELLPQLLTPSLSSSCSIAAINTLFSRFRVWFGDPMRYHTRFSTFDFLFLYFVFSDLRFQCSSVAYPGFQHGGGRGAVGGKGVGCVCGGVPFSATGASYCWSILSIQDTFRKLSEITTNSSKYGNTTLIFRNLKIITIPPSYYDMLQVLFTFSCYIFYGA